MTSTDRARILDRDVEAQSSGYRQGHRARVLPYSRRLPCLPRENAMLSMLGSGEVQPVSHGQTSIRLFAFLIIRSASRFISSISAGVSFVTSPRRYCCGRRRSPLANARAFRRLPCGRELLRRRCRRPFEQTRLDFAADQLIVLGTQREHCIVFLQLFSSIIATLVNGIAPFTRPHPRSFPAPILLTGVA